MRQNRRRIVERTGSRATHIHEQEIHERHDTRFVVHPGKVLVEREGEVSPARRAETEGSAERTHEEHIHIHPTFSIPPELIELLKDIASERRAATESRGTEREEHIRSTERDEERMKRILNDVIREIPKPTVNEHVLKSIKVQLYILEREIEEGKARKHADFQIPYLTPILDRLVKLVLSHARAPSFGALLTGNIYKYGVKLSPEELSERRKTWSFLKKAFEVGELEVVKFKEFNEAYKAHSSREDWSRCAELIERYKGFHDELNRAADGVVPLLKLETAEQEHLREYKYRMDRLTASLAQLKGKYHFVDKEVLRKTFLERRPPRDEDESLTPVA